MEEANGGGVVDLRFFFCGSASVFIYQLRIHLHILGYKTFCLL